MNRDTESIVWLAKEGDADALADLIRLVQDKIYRLATRMLANPVAAQDATQEILIRIITKLSTFKGDSRFETWAFRVATNYLLTARKIISNDLGLSFEVFGEDLLNNLVDDDAASPEDDAMVSELRVRCTMAMLLCLDRKHRVAYVFGEIFEMDNVEAAHVLEVTPANFRKRLSRARRDVQAFMMDKCSVANPAAPCSCPKRLPAALSCNRLGTKPSPELADAPDYATAIRQARNVTETLVSAKLQRSAGPLKTTRNFAAAVMALVETPG